MGVTQHCGGSDTSTAISNLLLVSGNYMRPGAGAYPLRGHNNVQGASDFGSMPNLFPGYQKVDDETVRSKFEAAWGMSLPTVKGLDNRMMIDAIHKGKLHSPLHQGRRHHHLRRQRQRRRTRSPHARLSRRAGRQLLRSPRSTPNVILPASPSLEKEGTFTNTERRIQRIYKALEPLGDSKPDWEIIQLIAQRLGANWNYTHPSEIMDEVASLTPLFAGVSYERLEGYRSLQWPVAKDGKDSPAPLPREIPLRRRQSKVLSHRMDRTLRAAHAEFDLHLNNGRLLEHFEQGSMTYRTEGIKRMTPRTFVEVSHELAEERGVTDGSYVQLRSPYGQVKVQVLVTDRVHGKELYMPMNSVLEPVNRMTSSHLDRATHTPAFKELSVQMTVLNEQGPNPLPRENFRWGHRTPQDGVDVENKWQRPDYYVPGTKPRDELVQIKTTTV